MLNRIERILTATCAQVAPHLLGEQKGREPQQLARMATELAKRGALILVGDAPKTTAEDLHQCVQPWVGGYLDLYGQLTTALFPSFSAYEANYADAEHPPIVLVRGQSLPVVRVLGHLIVPYVAQRQYDPRVTDAEIRGIVETTLDELEAADLPRPKYEALRHHCIALVRQLLNAPIRQIHLNAAWLATLVAPPPPSLPEDTPTEVMPAIPSAPPAAAKPDIPMFFVPRRNSAKPSGWRKAQDH